MWLSNFIRSLGIGFAIFSKRQPVAMLIVASFVCGFIWFGIHTLTETPQETKARETAQAQEAVENAAISARATAEHEAAKNRDRLLCKAKVVCARFAEVRQECAAAGNFRNCIQVKMGDEDYELIGSCANDGQLIGASSLPNSVDCFLSRFQ